MRYLILFLLLVPQEKPKKSLKDVKSLLPAWFATTGKERDKVREKMKKAGLDEILLTKADADWVERLALAGNPMLVKKSGEYTLDLDTAGKKAAMHVHVFGGYNPKTPAPLVLALHGGSQETTTYEGSRKVGREEMGYWSGACDSTKAILIAPSTTGFWSEKAGMEAIWGAIAHARENFNIDPNRIAVVGHSMGGFGIFDFAPTYADRFALAAPFVGGSDATGKLKNCRNLPFYIVIGAKDPMGYINDACRKNAKFLQDLKYDVTFKDRQDKGHDPIEDEFPAVLAKLQKSPRNMHAKQITRVSGNGRWYWIEADGAVEAEIKKDTIEITGSSVTAVFLSDRMLDLDKPVKIVIGGEVKFEGKVERSLAFMLSHVEESGDPGRLYTARVEIK